MLTQLQTAATCVPSLLCPLPARFLFPAYFVLLNFVILSFPKPLSEKEIFLHLLPQLFYLHAALCSVYRVLPALFKTNRVDIGTALLLHAMTGTQTFLILLEMFISANDSFFDTFPKFFETFSEIPSFLKTYRWHVWATIAWLSVQMLSEVTAETQQDIVNDVPPHSLSTTPTIFENKVAAEATSTPKLAPSPQVENCVGTPTMASEVNKEEVQALASKNVEMSEQDHLPKKKDSRTVLIDNDWIFRTPDKRQPMDRFRTVPAKASTLPSLDPLHSLNEQDAELKDFKDPKSETQYTAKYVERPPAALSSSLQSLRPVPRSKNIDTTALFGNKAKLGTQLQLNATQSQKCRKKLVVPGSQPARNRQSEAHSDSKTTELCGKDAKIVELQKGLEVAKEKANIHGVDLRAVKETLRTQAQECTKKDAQILQLQNDKAEESKSLETTIARLQEELSYQTDISKSLKHDNTRMENDSEVQARVCAEKDALVLQLQNGKIEESKFRDNTVARLQQELSSKTEVETSQKNTIIRMKNELEVKVRECTDINVQILQLQKDKIEEVKSKDNTIARLQQELSNKAEFENSQKHDVIRMNNELEVQAQKCTEMNAQLLQLQQERVEAVKQAGNYASQNDTIVLLQQQLSFKNVLEKSQQDSIIQMARELEVKAQECSSKDAQLLQLQNDNIEVANRVRDFASRNADTAHLLQQELNAKSVYIEAQEATISQQGMTIAGIVKELEDLKIEQQKIRRHQEMDIDLDYTPIASATVVQVEESSDEMDFEEDFYTEISQPSSSENFPRVLLNSTAGSAPQNATGNLSPSSVPLGSIGVGTGETEADSIHKNIEEISHNPAEQTRSDSVPNIVSNSVIASVPCGPKQITSMLNLHRAPQVVTNASIESSSCIPGLGTPLPFLAPLPTRSGLTKEAQKQRNFPTEKTALQNLPQLGPSCPTQSMNETKWVDAVVEALGELVTGEGDGLGDPALKVQNAEKNLGTIHSELFKHFPVSTLSSDADHQAFDDAWEGLTLTSRLKLSVNVKELSSYPIRKSVKMDPRWPSVKMILTKFLNRPLDQPYHSSPPSDSCSGRGHIEKRSRDGGETEVTISDPSYSGHENHDAQNTSGTEDGTEDSEEDGENKQATTSVPLEAGRFLEFLTTRMLDHQLDTKTRESSSQRKHLADWLSIYVDEMKPGGPIYSSAKGNEVYVAREIDNFLRAFPCGWSWYDEIDREYRIFHEGLQDLSDHLAVDLVAEPVPGRVKIALVRKSLFEVANWLGDGDQTELTRAMTYANIQLENAVAHWPGIRHKTSSMDLVKYVSEFRADPDLIFPKEFKKKQVKMFRLIDKILTL